MKQVVYTKLDNDIMLPIELKIRKHTEVRKVIHTLVNKYHENYDFASQQHRIALVLPQSFYTIDEAIPAEELLTTIDMSSAILIKGYSAIAKSLSDIPVS